MEIYESQIRATRQSLSLIFWSGISREFPGMGKDFPGMTYGDFPGISRREIPGKSPISHSRETFSHSREFPGNSRPKNQTKSTKIERVSQFRSKLGLLLMVPYLI